MNIPLLVNAIGKHSSHLSTVIEGPLGSLVASLLSHYFDSHIENLHKVIAEDPNAPFKINLFENEHFEDLAIISEDYNSYIKTKHKEINKKKSNPVRSTIAILVVIGFFTLSILNYFYPIRDDHVLIMLIGQVASGFLLVLSFYFTKES